MTALSFHTVEPVFDWYQFSAGTGVKELREILAPMAQDEPFRDESPKLKGYGWASKIGGPGGSVLIHYGGSNGDQYGPNVAGTGPLAPRVADLVRQANLSHGVGRVDVRLDFLGDFDDCRRRFIERCDKAGMAASDAGSCPESSRQLGRTVYGGSRSSLYRPTLYQKGLQLGDGHPENYLRLEHRFSPSKSAEKLQLAAMSPAEMVGLRPVSRDLTLSLVAMAIAPYKLDRYPKEKGPSFWMVKQYRGLLLEMLEDLGSEAAVGKQLFYEIAQQDKEERHH